MSIHKQYAWTSNINAKVHNQGEMRIDKSQARFMNDNMCKYPFIPGTIPGFIPGPENIQCKTKY